MKSNSNIKECQCEKINDDIFINDNCPVHPFTPVATEDWIESFDKKFKEKPKCKHGFTEGHYTCEPHDFPHVLGNRFGPDCETCNPPKEPTLQDIKDFISSYKKIWEEQEKTRLIKMVEGIFNQSEEPGKQHTETYFNYLKGYKKALDDIINAIK